jgi:hypothetical protein
MGNGQAGNGQACHCAWLCIAPSTLWTVLGGKRDRCARGMLAGSGTSGLYHQWSRPMLTCDKIPYPKSGCRVTMDPPGIIGLDHPSTWSSGLDHPIPQWTYPQWTIPQWTRPQWTGLGSGSFVDRPPFHQGDHR